MYNGEVAEESMRIGLLGDVHGDFPSVAEIMKANEDITCWLCTGDIADETGSYFSPPSPLYWVSGNHENWDAIGGLGKGTLVIPNLFHMPNAVVIKISGAHVLGLGGNYSPKHYGYKMKDLPQDRKRHYTKCEVEKCARHRNVDILITHEAPSPYYRNSEDIGRLEITEVLKAVKPRIHIFGHHHKFGIYDIAKGTKSVCLDRPESSWVRLSLADYSIERIHV